MKVFAELREKLRFLYAEHALLLDFAGRFVLACTLSFLIREKTGYNELFSRPLFLLSASLIAAVLQGGGLTLLAGVLACGQAFALGYEAFGLSIAVFFMLYLLLLRYAPECRCETAFTVIALYIPAAALAPILFGLRRKLSALMPLVAGTVIGALLALMSSAPEMTAALKAGDYAGRLEVLAGALFAEADAVRMAAVAAAFLLVYFLAGTDASYAPHVSVPAGGIVYLCVLLAGGAWLRIDVRLAEEAAGTAAAVIAGLILAALFYPFAYRKSERLRFEDDEYMYFVKAVPKYTRPEGPGRR